MNDDQPYMEFPNENDFTDFKEWHDLWPQTPFDKNSECNNFSENFHRDLIPYWDMKPWLKEQKTPEEYHQRPFYEVPYPDYNITVKEGQTYSFFSYELIKNGY